MYLEIEELSSHNNIFENSEKLLNKVKKSKTDKDADYGCYVYNDNLDLIEFFIFKDNLNLNFQNQDLLSHPKYTGSNCLKIVKIPCTSLDVKVYTITDNIEQVLSELRKFKTNKYCTSRIECYVFNSNLIEYFILDDSALTNTNLII